MDMGVSIDIWNKVLYIVKLNWYWIICCFISSGPRHLMLVFLTILLNLLVLSVLVVPEKYVYSMNIDNIIIIFTVVYLLAVHSMLLV